MRPADFDAAGLVRDINNPSRAAAFAMLLRYWAGDLDAPLERLVPDLRQWRQEDRREIGTLSALKDTLADGVPVLMELTLTPFGHPTAGPMLWGTPQPVVGPHSGILGTFLPFDTFSGNPGLRTIHLRESVFSAIRLAIGYDDDRGCLFLHDPSFGPAWDVSYENFEKMWQPIGAMDQGVPPDYRSRAATRAESAAYRERTVDERALEHYVFGYALACARNRTMAIEHYRTGLTLPGLKDGLRHLFLVELALQSEDPFEAITLLREALELVPANHTAWRILAQMYRQRGRGRLRVLYAQFRANLASTEPTRRQTFRAALPKGVLVFP